MYLPENYPAMVNTLGNCQYLFHTHQFHISQMDLISAEIYSRTPSVIGHIRKTNYVKENFQSLVSFS